MKEPDFPTVNDIVSYGAAGVTLALILCLQMLILIELNSEMATKFTDVVYITVVGLMVLSNWPMTRYAATRTANFIGNQVLGGDSA